MVRWWRDLDDGKWAIVVVHVAIAIGWFSGLGWSG